MTNLELAVKTYIARRDRNENPKGSFDKAGRWYPDAMLDCCNVRTPSRAYPYSLMVHCRTMAHIASEYGVDLKELKKAVKEAEKC